MMSLPPDAFSDKESQGSPSQRVLVAATTICVEMTDDTNKEKINHDSFSDIKILAGPNEEVIQCHRFILAKNSEVLCTMLGSRWSTDSSGATELYLPTDDPEAFRTLIQYLYAGELKSDLPSVTLLQVLDLTKKYDIPSLTTKVIARLLTVITTDNALSIYFAAKLHDIVELQARAFDIVSVDTSEIILSDEFLGLSYDNLCDFLAYDELRVSEVKLLLATCRWSEEACIINNMEVTPQNCRSVLKDALQLIRYDEMTAEQFSEVAEDKDIFEYWEKYEILHELSNFPPKEKRTRLTFEYNKQPRHSLIESFDAKGIFLFKRKTPELYDSGLATTFVKVNKLISIHTIAVVLPKKTVGMGNRGNRNLMTITIKSDGGSSDKQNSGTVATQYVKLEWLKPLYCKFKLDKLVTLVPDRFYEISFKVDRGPSVFTETKQMEKTEYRVRCMSTDVIFSFKSPVQTVELQPKPNDGVSKSGNNVSISADGGTKSKDSKPEERRFQLPQLSFILGK